MSVFGRSFERNHVEILAAGKKYQTAQLAKMAADRFLARGDTTNSVIFFTANELQEFTAYVEKCVPRGRIYSKNKPLTVTYPVDKQYCSRQQITAIVTVSKRDRSDLRLYQAYTVREGINYGPTPTVTFLYGQLDTPTGKEYGVFHYDNVMYDRVPEHKPFSLSQIRALNTAATVGGTEEAWITPLFSDI